MENRKYILVTGASTGIGWDLCKLLIEKGFAVIATVRKESDKVKLENAFPQYLQVKIMDLIKNDDIDRVAHELKNELKNDGLAGLINNAGIAKGGPLLLVTNIEFDHQMQVNFLSIFRLTNALLPLLGAEKSTPYAPGRIVNISSVSGLINTPMLGPYCISKHALESMSDIYRRELAVYGIKVILIEPGPIKTPIWNKSVPKENPYMDTDFEKVYIEFRKQVENSEKNALPVSKVSSAVHKAMLKKKPSPRYVISKTPLLIRVLSNLIPASLLDKIFIKQLKKGMK